MQSLREGHNLKDTVGMSLIQMAYTGLFGYMSMDLLLKTGSVWPSVFSHIVCNVMGLPDITFSLKKAKLGTINKQISVMHEERDN